MALAPGLMSYRYESKPEGYQGAADYESANVAGVVAPGQYDSTDDVFGNEDGAQVRENLAFQDIGLGN